MSLSLRLVLPLALLSVLLFATTEAVALDRLCLMAGISFRPPAKTVHDQELKRLTTDVEKAKDAIATNQDHLDYWWELAVAQKCLPSGKPGLSAECKHSLENISLFARTERQLQSEFDTNKAALDDLLTGTSKAFQAEAENSGNMEKCATAALAAPEAAKPGEVSTKPAGPFSIELFVNGQGCSATPDKNCLKEFDLKRGKDAPTPPLTIVAKTAGFPRRCH